jgi:integrase
MTDNKIKVVVVKRHGRRFLTMRFVDPVTGQQKTRSTKTSNRREAERLAAKWEAELQEGRYHEPSRITWEEFRERYEDEKLSSLSCNTAEATSAAFNHLEAIINPQKLCALDATVLSRFQAGLRKTGMHETSIATHLRQLRAALGWAVSMGLLPKVPQIQMPKRAKGRTLMRGRPISTEEFERVLAAVPAVRPQDAETWIHYLTGVWLSGLRLEESTVFSWDDDAPITVELGGRRPRIRIFAEAEKGHQDRLLPMTPDFAQFLALTPAAKRTGPVFKLIGLQTGRAITPKRISRIVSAIGKRANVVVNKADGKYASAHDLRRSFGTRWAGRVKPATLQLLMRHKSIETTLKYYVEQDADDVADELWKSFPPEVIEPGTESQQEKRPNL